MASASVEIEGLREFQRNLAKINRGAAGAVRKGIRRAASPVAKHVETVTVRDISNVGPQWSRMRIGAPAGQVYIAPRARNRGGSPRPNMAGLLGQSMRSGVRDKRTEFIRDVQREFDDLARSAGF